MVSIVDPETKRPLVHQLHRIPGIAIGRTSWDRSYYMNEVESQLDIALGRSIATSVNLTCELWDDGQPTPIRSQRISVDELARIVPYVALVQVGDAKRPPTGEQNRCPLGQGVIPIED